MVPEQNNPEYVLENTKYFYTGGLEKFDKKLDAFLSDIDQYKNDNIDIERLRSSFGEVRLTFKKIEFLLDYLDPESVYYHMNGAPLPKLEKNVPEINVLDPSGLQTIDEIIYADELDLEEIAALSNQLDIQYDNIIKYQKTIKLQHRYLIESLRYGIVRIYTLGLTGFDTPGSANGIAEAISSIDGMMIVLHNYKSLGQGSNDGLYDQIIDDYAQFKKYLHAHDDFDTLDRYEILIKFVNPIYENLLLFQKSMNIELKSEVDPTLSPHNYMSTNLFDTDFYDLSYFTKVPKKDLSNQKKISLGETLFYDPILSKDLDLSCASCHEPSKAFTDGLPKSKTNEAGVSTQRNSPTLINSALYNGYFLDMRETSLERQVKHVVMDKHEFNIDFIQLADRLKQSKEYRSLFDEAYGTEDKYQISSWSISNALACYVASLTSFDSEFDQYVRDEVEEIPVEIRNGYNLFMGKASCGTCHFAPAFNGTVPPFYKDSESEVLGVLTTYDTLNPMLDNDPGRINNGITQESAPHFHRSFKTVTVRNAEVTAPYMHNGGIETMEDLMDFYNKGGGAGMGIEVPHQTLPDAALDLSPSEITDIIAFINSLTDYEQFVKEKPALPAFENEAWNSRK